MSNGLVACRHPGNSTYNQVEPLITVEKLKETYLFGKFKFQDEEGRSISDEALQTFIDNAISMIEHDLDIAVVQRQQTETKDYNANDYYEWGFLQLNRTPVISLDSLKVVYTRNTTEYDTILDIPPEWIRLEPDSGIIRLIPNNRFPGRLASNGAGFFPELFNRHSMVPGMWLIQYTHGFKPGCIPSALNAAIGLVASVFTLNVLGDLIIGAGIAGTSLSLDGLSQSIQTTASAENHGFSGLVKDYNRQLFGDRTLGTSGIIEILRHYYKGQAINII